MTSGKSAMLKKKHSVKKKKPNVFFLSANDKKSVDTTSILKYLYQRKNPEVRINNYGFPKRPMKLRGLRQSESRKQLPGWQGKRILSKM